MEIIIAVILIYLAFAGTVALIAISSAMAVVFLNLIECLLQKKTQPTIKQLRKLIVK